MSQWLLDKISEKRTEALQTADRIQVRKELLNEDTVVDTSNLHAVSAALELAVLDLILDGFEEDNEKQKMMRECAADAFRIIRVLPLPEDGLAASVKLLRMSCLAVLADRGADAARFLNHNDWPLLPIDSDDWGERTWSIVIDVWLRLFRKKGWDDRDTVLQRVSELREQQRHYEESYLNGVNTEHAKAAALELIALYHLAKAAEIMAEFITDGVVDDNYQVRQLLESQFDRVLAVCEHARMIELEPMTRFLSASALQMVENSNWTVNSLY